MPTVLIAPSTFKASLAAIEVATAIETAILACCPDSLSIHCQRKPVADGGDDTLHTLMQDKSAQWLEKTTAITGPIPPLKVLARWLYSKPLNCVVIEAAQAHGLALLLHDTHNYQPMAATSYGVGQLIQEALRLQPKTIIITLGGSGSTDGGLGALQALGLRCYDRAGSLLSRPLAAQDLEQIVRIDASAFLAFANHWPAVRFMIATDTQNPLLGPLGTAHTFAAQKGASPKQVAHIETGLQSLSNLMQEVFGADDKNTPGAGAAGGLGYGLLHWPGASVVSGFDWLAEAIDLKRDIELADWIITGEGRLDATSFQGKATGRLMTMCAEHNKPLLIICGSQAEGLALPERVPERLIIVTLSSLMPVAVAMAEPRQAITTVIQHYRKDWLQLMS